MTNIIKAVYLKRVETFTETFTEIRGEIMATIKDIARLSGYSIGTVSRVINNRADVSPEARETIERIIQEQNYQPNTNAKMLKQTVSSDIRCPQTALRLSSR